MYVQQDFDPIEPGETDVFTIEFTADLAVGQSLVSSSWTCAVDNTITGKTVDATPSARIAGSSTITSIGNRWFANQTFTGMVDGNTYILQATVTTSDGRTLQRYSHVLCLAAT